MRTTAIAKNASAPELTNCRASHTGPEGATIPEAPKAAMQRPNTNAMVFTTVPPAARLKLPADVRRREANRYCAGTMKASKMPLYGAAAGSRAPLARTPLALPEMVKWQYTSLTPPSCAANVP